MIGLNLYSTGHVLLNRTLIRSTKDWTLLYWTEPLKNLDLFNWIKPPKAWTRMNCTEPLIEMDPI